MGGLFVQGVNLKKKLLQNFHQLPQKLQNSPILVAVSGGMDSSVLASVALELKGHLPPLHFVHVNYHLRRPDSDIEEAALAAWAAKEKIPFHVRRFYPQKKPVNLQAWARGKRLKFFADVLQKVNKGRGIVCLAHHQQDQAETILARMLRGAALRGLSGMEQLESLVFVDKLYLDQPLYLFRPFLEVPHHAIVRYAKGHRLRYHQDKSNLSDIYLRNRIRHQILPLMLKENPQALEALTALGKRAGEATQLMDELASDWLNQQSSKNGNETHIPVTPLKSFSEGLRAAIFEQWIFTNTQERQALGKILPRMLQFIAQPRESLQIPLKGDYVLHLEKTGLSLKKVARGKGRIKLGTSQKLSK
jgi:tRNA(Ile)-lysidine synthetase-like protein